MSAILYIVGWTSICLALALVMAFPVLALPFGLILIGVIA